MTPVDPPTALPAPWSDPSHDVQGDIDRFIEADRIRAATNREPTTVALPDPAKIYVGMDLAGDETAFVAMIEIAGVKTLVDVLDVKPEEARTIGRERARVSAQHAREWADEMRKIGESGRRGHAAVARLSVTARAGRRRGLAAQRSTYGPQKTRR